LLSEIYLTKNQYAYLCHMISIELVFFSFLYIKLLELGVEVALSHRSAVNPHKLNVLKFPLRTAALSALMMLLFCSFASASFTARNPSSLAVDRLNSKIYTIFRASLIATPSGRLPQRRLTKKNSGSRLCRASWLWLFLTGTVTTIPCAFSASSCLL